MKVTIKEVAKLANVSPSTVSRVISDSSRISEDTKKKVNEAMKSLGYHPNAIARSLVKQLTHTIGVIMPRSAHQSLANPFFPEALRGISASASQRGFYVMLSIEDMERDKHHNIENIVRAGIVDGIVMLYSKVEDQTFSMLKDIKFPFVVVGKPVNGNKVNYVDNDNISAAYEATAHLIDRGKTSIGVITGPLNLVVSLDRLEGYKRALNDHGIPFDPTLQQEADFSEEGGYKAMKNFLERTFAVDKLQPGSLEQQNRPYSQMAKNCPQAILCIDDLMSLGAMRAVKEFNMNIPEDISIVSFNNIPTAGFLTPPLTSVDINPYELGYEATELLFQCLNKDKNSPQARIIPTKLIIRQSS